MRIPKRCLALPTMKEDDFQTQIIGLAHLLGWRVAHFRPARGKDRLNPHTGRLEPVWRTPCQADAKGFPDLVLVRDRVIYAELKSATGSLTDEEKQWRDWLLTAGQEWYMWRPRQYDEIETLLRRKQ